VRTGLVALLVLAALALVAAPATAKEVARAAVCGADGCHAVAGNGEPGHEDSRFQLMAWGPEQRKPPGTVGSYYVLRVFMRIDDSGGTQQIVTRWFPEDRLIAASGPDSPDTMWMQPDREVEAYLRRATRGIPPGSPRYVPATVLGDVRPRLDPCAAR
jgi:hypothetical protein